MKIRTRRAAAILCAAAWALLGFAHQSRAETGSTNIISGSTVNVAGNWMVGTNGAFNTMILTNGGVLKVTANSTVGNSSVSSNNNAWIVGSGSLWSNRANFYVGATGSFNQLTIANGGQVLSSNSIIGCTSDSSGNIVVVTGAGSVWSNSASLDVGSTGSFNSLTIADGAKVFSMGGWLGSSGVSSNNMALITGTGSVWSLTRTPLVGSSGSGNSLIVTNGGALLSSDGRIGNLSSSSNNLVLVAGASSVWSNKGPLYVGFNGSYNQLILADGGSVISTNVIVGGNLTSGTNSITVSGGMLQITNASSLGKLDIRRGTLTLNSGTVTVDRLIITNGSSSLFNFTAGLLRSSGITVSNGVAFTVGGGTSVATLDLLGGTHSFANGLLLSSNANLIGSGTIIGSVTNFGGIAPGHSAGLLAITGDLALMDSSVLTMEVGGPDTNQYDRIVANGFLRVGGLLSVVFTNGYTPEKGAIYDLFSYGSISGAFSQTNLPTFQYAGTDWDTSHLLAPASDPLSGSLIFIPEPATGMLMLAGAGVVWARRGRRKQV
ncbi:MAG: PEP-CTERM sorting domain-containing protein [Verrucomicrobia bacterium]|nr:PEP-CTERM sorting domain-containing protein [Verrucomicrobiota bacterium]